MKVIIAGDRNITDYELVKEAIEESGFEITEVVCGMAQGVDSLGLRWADENGIQVEEFPADWDRYGNAAGPIRNTQMANYADALIAIPTKDSRGTRNMIAQASNRDLKIFVKEA